MPLALSTGAWVALILVALTVALALSRAGWLKLFGPVLQYAIVRSARRGRLFLVRTLYVVGLFFLLFWVRASWHDHLPATATPQQLTDLGEAFFWTFATTQFFAAVLLTPGYVAGSISDDKERRTLDFLLATDLANREIVFGNTAARVGNLLMLLLAGLPVLSLIQFFGGIDPAVLLLVFGVTGMTVLGLVGVAVVQSVQRRRTREAILLTYVVALGYLGVSLLLWGLKVSSVGFAGTLLGTFVGWAEPAIDVFRWGDPLRAIVEFQSAIGGAGPTGPAFVQLLGEYATFHGAVFGLGLGYAAWRLRAIALAQAGRGDVRRNGRRSARRRPPVSERPMVWKEVYVEGTLRLGLVGRFGLNLLVALGFTPLCLIVYLFFFEPRGGGLSLGSWDEMRQGVNGWLRTMNTLVSSVALVGIAVRAAGAVGGERDRDTLVSLLTTPLSARDMLAGKYWGALASVRGLIYWLAITWLAATVLGAVNPLAALVQAAVFVPPACAAAAVGIYLSVRCRTTLRAVVGTILAMVFGLGGHWAVGCMCCYLPGSLGGLGNNEFPVAFQVGMTPPAVFALVPIRVDDIQLFGKDLQAYLIVSAAGVASWLLVAAILWKMALERFTLATNRAEYTGPAALLPPPVAA